MGVVVGILALSFAVWGIGDIFRGSSRSAVASVGGNEITAEQFRTVYNERLQELSRQQRRPITLAQAAAAGLDRQILAVMISEMALDEWARRMGLGITDAEVARLIRTIPAFQGADGQFDHSMFIQRIRSAGYTEPRFVNEQRRVMIRQHLTDSIGGVTFVPKTYIDAVNAYQNEQRDIEYVVLGSAQAGEIPAPTAEELTAFFEANKTQFRAPEYRKLAVVRLSPDDVTKWIQVTDEDARKYYDERRARYTTAGRRQVQQIVFPTEDEAKLAKERITGGAAFVEIARERGLSEQDIDLGFVRRNAFATAPAVGEAAFSLPEGGVSNPVQSRLGTALVRVLKIEPDVVRPFEEVAEEIKQEVARERARTELTQKHDTIEDERAGGTNLTDAAQKAGLAVTTIEAVDRTGRDPSGAPVTGFPPDVDVLTPAFAARAGVEADAIRLDQGGYVWFEVLDITPSKERSLEEVREQVETRWRDEKIAEQLAAKAAAMVEKIKAGASLADVAAAENLTIQTAADLNRAGRTEAVPPAAVAAAFRTAKGAAASSAGSRATERIVFRVTDVTVPAMDMASDQGRRLEESLRTLLSQDLMRQYLASIERSLGVSVNADALRRVAGGESS